MSSLMENINNEIILIMSREDMETPLNSIGNENVKIKTMFSTLNKYINKNLYRLFSWS